ncbi:MAG: methyltransferase domain-containing protein [Chthoniobacterales bacterium]
MRMFAGILRPAPEDMILDVGGYAPFWLETPIDVKGVDTVNPDHVEAPTGTKPPIHSMKGDGCDLPFADKSYAILFSNSVIEHVGDFEDQKKFAAEARRVGRKLWIQTPAFAFPIEPHCLAPFVHWFPWSIRKRLLRFTPVALLGRTPWEEYCDSMRRTRILKKREVEELFPDCEVLTERVFGVLPKCYIACRRG